MLGGIATGMRGRIDRLVVLAGVRARTRGDAHVRHRGAQGVGVHLRRCMGMRNPPIRVSGLLGLWVLLVLLGRIRVLRLRIAVATTERCRAVVWLLRVVRHGDCAGRRQSCARSCR
jgi:hypothetical protein